MAEELDSIVLKVFLQNLTYSSPRGAHPVLPCCLCRLAFHSQAPTSEVQLQSLFVALLQPSLVVFSLVRGRRQLQLHLPFLSAVLLMLPVQQSNVMADLVSVLGTGKAPGPYCLATSCSVWLEEDTYCTLQ